MERRIVDLPTTARRKLIVTDGCLLLALSRMKNGLDWLFKMDADVWIFDIAIGQADGRCHRERGGAYKTRNAVLDRWVTRHFDKITIVVTEAGLEYIGARSLSVMLRELDEGKDPDHPLGPQTWHVRPFVAEKTMAALAEIIPAHEDLTIIAEDMDARRHAWSKDVGIDLLNTWMFVARMASGHGIKAARDMLLDPEKYLSPAPASKRFPLSVTQMGRLIERHHPMGERYRPPQDR